MTGLQAVRGVVVNDAMIFLLQKEEFGKIRPVYGLPVVTVWRAESLSSSLGSVL